MSETNAERLATTKNAVQHAREFIDEDGELSFQYGEKVLDDFDWLIEQAEYVKDLEGELKNERQCYSNEAERNKRQLLDRIKLKKENERLREALNTIAWNFEATNPQAMFMKDTARQALKGKRDG